MEKRLDDGLRRVYPRVCGGATVEPPNSRRIQMRRGSIPACAGEPRTCDTRITLSGAIGVYPRVCGGARVIDNVAFRQARRRVYPRVCGGALPAHHFCQLIRFRGSIPACAGEPTRSIRGTGCLVELGLSPRVRGSHQETGRRSFHAMARWVYPRVCGGALLVAVSSYVRMQAVGSIPACAGEPGTIVQT